MIYFIASILSVFSHDLDLKHGYNYFFLNQVISFGVFEVQIFFLQIYEV